MVQVVKQLIESNTFFVFLRWRGFGSMFVIFGEKCRRKTTKDTGDGEATTHVSRTVANPGRSLLTLLRYVRSNSLDQR